MTYIYDNQSKIIEISNNEKEILNPKNFSQYKEMKTPNIYYVVLDEMTSISHYNSMFPGANEKEILEKILENNIYVDDLSTFSLTTLTLASVLNLDRIVQFGDNISKYNHNKILFPKNLSKANYRLGQEPLLVKILDQAGYDFYWFGNNWGNCKSYNVNLCYTDNRKINFKNNIYNPAIIVAFFKHAPLEIILRKLLQISNEKNLYIGSDYVENDAISKFLKISNNINKKKKYFFLIHHFSPHKPYIYNSDCSFDSKLKKNIDDELQGYKNGYSCALKKIYKFLDYIDRSDPHSIVIIQGDHGFKNDDNFTKKHEVDKFKIFNLLKLPKKCDINLPKNNRIGNINSMRIALNCALTIDLKMIDSHPAYSNKQKNKKFGEVKRLEIN